MRVKKACSFTLVLMLSISLLAACSPVNLSESAQVKGEQSNSLGGKLVEIRFPWWGNVVRHEKYNKLMDMFEAKNPNIKVIREPGSWEDYWKKISVQTIGGNAPDVLMFTTVGQMPEYEDKGALLPLDKYIENGSIDVSGIPEKVIELGKYKGRTYMITKGLAALSYTVNLSLLSQKGAPLPKNEYASWGEFIDYLKLIKPKLGKNEWGKEIYPLADMASDDLYMESFMRLKGKDMFSDDGRELGFSKQDLVEWFTLWQDLKKLGIVPPAKITAEEGTLQWEQDMLASKRIVMSARPGNHIKSIMKYMSDELTLIRLPGDNGKFGEVLTGAFLGISAQSKHPDDVAKLINMWMTDLEFNKLYEHEHGIVQNENVVKGIQLDPGDQLSLKNMKEVMSTTKPQKSRLPGVASIFDQVKKSYDEVNFGEKSIEKAADDIFTEANRVLRKQK
ncbi:extracellular solute-binding protein [Paenibacillus piri]|uniref:Extracellular solute-binding protein n=1 Tax=Paenibacillus piri TaxID=2547395 RepID=A0A4R5K748_9BACL|nr:extracellular solute-binding protein [Paenibacillus piri]